MNKEGGRLSVLLITVENSRRIGCTSDTGHPHVGGGPLTQNVAHLRTCVLDGGGGRAGPGAGMQLSLAGSRRCLPPWGLWVDE